MSSLSASLYGTSMNKGVGGLLSGLNTDDLVNQMTAATRNKINRQYQSKQKLLYKQEAYREISKKLLTFSDKYFSYASGSKTNILSPIFFESNTYKPSSSYVNVTGNAENIKNFSIDSITTVATAASFSSNKKVASASFESESITTKTSILAGATFTLEFGNEKYNLTIDKGFGNGNEDVTLDQVVTQLNKQLATIEGNKNKDLLEYKVDNGKIVFVEGKGTAKLIAASSVITDNLKMKVGENAVSTTGLEVEQIKLLTKDAIDILKSKDSYITFDFNSVTKTINLAEKVTVPNEAGTDLEEINLVDANSLKRYFQYELNKAYGKDKVIVAEIGNKLSFSAKNGDTDIFGVSSISKDLSNFTGIESGDYNRINKTKPIVDLGIAGIKEENAVDIGDGKKGFIINVNDTEIKIESTMSITEVINKINSNAAVGVKVYYSPTTNTFTVKATETGIHKGVSITDVENGGNLAQALFGTGICLEDKLDEGQYIKYEDGKAVGIYKLEDDKTETEIAKVLYDEENNKFTIDYVDDAITDISNIDYIIKPGTDTEMTYTLNGVQNKVTRSTANFTIDEIKIELNDKASTIDFSKPVTFDVTNNSDEIVKKVKQFIDDYNEIINLIGTKTSEKPNRNYLPLTPEQQDEMEEEEIKNWTTEAKKGVLYGDSKMNAVLSRMRSSMSGLTDVSTLTLSSIGISSASMDTSGKLVFDEKKFKEKLIENPDEIGKLFTNISSVSSKEAKSGIAVQLQQIIRDNVGAYGTTGLLIEEAGMDNSMTSDRNYISEKMKQYEDKMAELKKDLEAERKRYWNQFSALEQSLNKLNAQSSWLTDMMGS